MKIRPPKAEDWLNSKLVNEIVSAVQANKFPSHRKQEFRVSSLPMCPLLDIVDQKETKEKFEEYESNFYFSIGNALHLLFQKFAKDAKETTLVGDWKCTTVISSKQDSNPPSTTVTKCAKAYEFCSFNKIKKTHTCPHNLKSCKAANFEYEEITILYNGLSGHIDLLFKINGKFYLIDIKTTGAYLFQSTEQAIQRGYYPSVKYWHQVETYSVLLEKLKGIKVYAYAILYVSRDNTSNKRKGHVPFVRKLDDRMRKNRLELIDAQVGYNKEATAFVKKPTSGRLKRIWLDRPCQTKKDYDNIMAAKYFGKEMCPFMKDGSCMSGKIQKKILKMYEV